MLPQNEGLAYCLARVMIDIPTCGAFIEVKK